MSKPHRCADCAHRPRRRVTATAKTQAGKKIAEPRLHKKPCQCDCHQTTTPVAP